VAIVEEWLTKGLPDFEKNKKERERERHADADGEISFSSKIQLY
jgi:hypothetical protein